MSLLEDKLPYLLQMHGWCTEDKMRHLYGLVIKHHEDNPNITPVSVELGVFAGRSALPMAIAHKEINKGYLVAIDAWTVEATQEGSNSKENDEWWASLSNIEQMFDYFHKSIEALEVGGRVSVIKEKAEDVAPRVSDGSITLLHIDGNHSEEKSCQDVELWLPKVVGGGYIVLDDTGWATVKKAYNMLKAVCDIEFEKEGENSYTVFKKK